MKGFYPQILKQAYSLTKDHKIFWVAGLFLVWPNLFRAMLWAMLVITILKVPQDYQTAQAMQEGNFWVGLISIFGISLLVAYYYRSRAVVSVAVKQLRQHTTVEKTKVYQEADPFTWELIKFGFTLSLGLMLLIAFLSSPVTYLAANSFDHRAFFLGLFAFSVFLPIFTVLYYSMVFVPMFTVIYQIPVWQAFRVSFDLVKRNWVFLVLTSILLLAIELLAIILALFVLYLCSLGFVILAQIFYNVGGSGTVNILQVLVAILGFVVFFISLSIIAVFQRIVWVIVFFEIVKPVKPEEVLETVTVPEVISQ